MQYHLRMLTLKELTIIGAYTRQLDKHLQANRRWKLKTNDWTKNITLLDTNNSH